MPRFFKRYWYGRIHSEHFLYSLERDALFDPWCIQEAFNLLKRLLEPYPNARYENMAFGLGLTSEMVRNHIEFLERSHFSMNPYA